MSVDPRSTTLTSCGLGFCVVHDGTTVLPYFDEDEGVVVRMDRCDYAEYDHYRRKCDIRILYYRGEASYLDTDHHAKS